MGSNLDNLSSKSSIDILLLCALFDEFNQVLAVKDGLSSNGWQKSNDESGRIIADGLFETKDGGVLNIRATWIGYMGREQVQAIASVIIKETPAKCIAMSGICAGRRGKVELGDVIIAERLWSYDSGKSVIEDGQDVFQGDMLQYRPSEVFVQHMQSLDIPSDAPWLTERPRLPFEYQENWVLLRLLEGTNPVEHQNFNEDCPNWSEVLPRLWKRDWVKEPLELTEQGRNHIKRVSLLYPKNLPRPADFQVHVAPLATGSVVKEDEFIFPKLAKSMRKVLGLDMEASGLAALSEAHGVPVVVAKAVSDYGDQFKDDRYRDFAARASAESLISLLRATSHLFLTKEEKTTQIRSVPSAIEANIIPATPSPKALVNMLAELYPDVSETRFLWERAGGKARDIENISRPRDLWQRLWNRCLQGAVVSPKVLLTTILEEYPDNSLIVSQLDSLSSH